MVFAEKQEVLLFTEIEAMFFMTLESNQMRSGDAPICTEFVNTKMFLWALRNNQKLSQKRRQCDNAQFLANETFAMAVLAFVQNSLLGYTMNAKRNTFLSSGPAP